MTSLTSLGPLVACSTCAKCLTAQEPSLPPFALANYYYYANDRLPEHVGQAFAEASPFDLILVS